MLAVAVDAQDLAQIKIGQSIASDSSQSMERLVARGKYVEYKDAYDA